MGADAGGGGNIEHVTCTRAGDAQRSRPGFGGAAGYTHWGWLFVSHLWIADEHRGDGLGSQLMAAIEEAARDRGASSAHVDTYDFQAVDFYKKIGYEVFGQLDEYPTGHTRYFLKRSI